MAKHFTFKSGKPGDGSSKVSTMGESAAKSGSGGGGGLPKASSSVGITGDSVPESSNGNSGLPKAETKVGATGDNAAK